MAQIHITNRNKRLLLIIKYLLCTYNITWYHESNHDCVVKFFRRVCVKLLCYDGYNNNLYL
jgi:hypothetical protein